MSDNLNPPPTNSTPEPEDPRESLRKGLDKTRLSPEEMAQILAELPPPEERERLLREMQQNGGLSFEEFCESLGIEAK